MVTPYGPEDPGLRRALLFALLGYVYLALTIVLLGAATVLLFRVGQGYLGGAVGGLAISVLFSLWVAIQRPHGIAITREQFPALFRAADRARAGQRSAALDGVFLNEELNAGVMERPRFGVLGWSQRYLVVGLPLLHALSGEELEAILAHEFAHLSREHNRGQRLLARARTTWTGLTLGLRQSGHWGAYLFLPFFRWYAPRLELLAQESSRAHEYESDRLAARAVGSEVMGRALVRLTVQQRRLAHRLVPGALAGSRLAAEPDPAAFARLIARLGEPVEHAPGAVAMALSEQTLDDHSHPSLADRLRSLGVSADPAAVSATLGAHREPSAAAALPVEVPPALLDELGAAWARTLEPLWRLSHEDARAADAADTEPREAARAAARWAGRCEPPEVAIPRLRQALRDDADFAEGRVLLALLILDQDDASAWEEAVAMLEAESRRESPLAAAAVEALRSHYARTGRADAAARIAARERELEDTLQGAMRERLSLHASDTLRPWTGPRAQRERIREAVAQHPSVARAYLVQKLNPRLPDATLVVLAFEMGKVKWYRFSGGAAAQTVSQALLPHLLLGEGTDCLVVPIEAGRLRRRLRGMKGAEIYPGPLPVSPPGGEAAWQKPRGVQRIGLGSIPLATAWLLIILGGGGLRWCEGGGTVTLAELRDAAARDSSDARAWKELAWRLVDDGAWTAARPVLERAARLNPRDADLQSSLGWALLLEDRVEESLVPLREAIALDAEHLQANHNLGWALFRLGRMNEAEAAFRSALRLDRSSGRVHTDLGVLLLEMDRTGEAEGMLRVALALDSTLLRARLGLSSVRERQGRMDEAEEQLRAAVRLAPDEAAVWSRLGLVQHLRREYAASARSLARADSLDPAYVRGNRDLLEVWDASRRGVPLRSAAR